MQHVSWYRENQEIEYSNSQIISIIDEYVHSERDRAILKRRFVDGICYEPLAEEFNLSVRQVKNIIYRYDKILFLHVLTNDKKHPN